MQHTYIQKTLFNHASPMNKVAGFHERREKERKIFTNIYKSQIQPNLSFKIVLKELSDSENFASLGRLFHSDAPI